jgi:hypothetical protein
MKKACSLTVSLLLALGAAAGCASDGADDAQTPDEATKLTIVGERTLRLENGWATELTVRYTDLDDAPLAGSIDFVIDGEPAGAFLSAEQAVTNASGEATVTLTTGSTGDAAFDVSATAEGADAVAWDISVLERALDPTGTYRVTSEFDLASGLPGTAGTVINEFIEMTDDPYDPATYVLDKIRASITNGTVQDFLDDARPALDAILNEVLLQATPDVVAKLVEMGDAFGQIAHKFGTTSELTVTSTNDVDTGLAAAHVLTGLVFTIDGESFPYALADMGLENVSTPAPFSYNAQRFTIGDHAFPLSYGTILMVALEQIIIPLLDDSAHDLRSLLASYIDCAAVGAAIADYIGFGSDGLYEGACDLGLDAASGFVEEKILSLDSSAMQLGIHGSAKWIDSNHDWKVDVLQGGAWEGQMTYGTAPAPLGPSTFRGERMTAPQ